MDPASVGQRALLASLSNDLTAAILALVPLRERVFKCALVCKRWHELVTTEPQLLQSLELQASSDSASNGRFSSLLRFLSAAAPHVRQLSLSLEARGHYTGSEMRQLAAHLHTCLARCTQLESLSPRLGSVPCTLGPWLAPLAGSLRRLELEYKISVPGSDNTLRLEPEGLAACTQLEALALIGSAVWLQAPVAGCWPAGITSLELRLSWLSELPTSFAVLSSLRRLSVASFEGKPNRWEALSTLTTLRTLELDHCKFLPAPELLTALVQLQSVELLSSPADHDGDGFSSNSEDESDDEPDMLSSSELDYALEALGRLQLAHMKISGCNFLPTLPCEVRRLSSLRSFSFDFDPEDDSALRDWRRLRLPHGTWHHNLTRLELPHAILAAPAVLQALQACTQLEELTVGRFSLPPQQPLPEALHFVAWVGALPRLARLTVGLCEGWSEVPPGMPRHYERSSRQGDTWSADIEPAECMLQRQGLAAMGTLATAALEAQARRPGLTIRIVSDAELHPDGQEGEWVPCSY
ncbi:hypothetical protein COHA_001099 [Chlorella ohadii]|uniref:F-box domain-containing protein n=1 Tax=Chlorella ohadii TaxID=2649997 RepID=A0AAD5E008_9CHLO|nr:hypothetical protein COHA_001099 [Chlorella ohadii]